VSILTLVSKRGNLLNTLHGSLIYIMRAEATDLSYMYGATISFQNAYAEMEFNMKVHGKMDRKAYFHYIVNPEPKEQIDLDEFYLAGIQLAELLAHFYGFYQVVMAIHFDKATYHMHFIACSIDWQTGERLDMNKSRLYELRAVVSNILQQHGISKIRERT